MGRDALIEVFESVYHDTFSSGFYSEEELPILYLLDKILTQLRKYDEQDMGV
jgi:hypothetical protein